jgi:hypothetical protein
MSLRKRERPVDLVALEELPVGQGLPEAAEIAVDRSIPDHRRTQENDKFRSSRRVVAVVENLAEKRDIAEARQAPGPVVQAIFHQAAEYRDVAAFDTHHRLDLAHANLRHQVFDVVPASSGLGSCFSSAILEIDGRTLRVTVPLSLICAVRLMKKPIETDCGVVVVVTVALVLVLPGTTSCLTLK